jgi:hypothetical protein
MPEDGHSMVRTPRKGVRSLQAYQSEVCNHPGVDGDPEVAEVSFMVKRWLRCSIT